MARLQFLRPKGDRIQIALTKFKIPICITFEQSDNTLSQVGISECEQSNSFDDHQCRNWRGQLSLSSTYTQTTNVNATVDWNNGNIQEISTFLCNGVKSIRMSNVRDAASYTLLLSGTAAHTGPCQFLGGTFKTSGGNVAPISGKDVLFTFTAINGIIVYSMVDNLQ